MISLRFRVVLVLVAALLLSTCSRPQVPVDPGQLPGRTTFYLLWHGTPAGEIRTKNSLYALWDDPEFSSARASFLEVALSEGQKPKEKPTLSREEAAQYVTLLDNPFLVGYLHRPTTPAATTSSTNNKTTWNGVFFIYDRTGKEELLSKAVVRLRSAETDIPKLTPLTVAGVSALKVERKSGTTYWAEFSKYAVSAQELSVFEEILNLLNGKPGSDALSQAAVFQEAKPMLSGGIVEFFLNISSIRELALESPDGSSSQLKPYLTALKLDSVHSLAGHISLEGAKTRVQAAVLGDASPGGLFDIWAVGQANPASLAFLPPETVYYNESQFDLLGIYKILKRVFQQAGGTSAQAPNPIETAVETRLGMPLPDALGTVTGEIASLQTSPTFEDSQKIYFVGIRNKADALKLTRTIMGDRITSERNEGDITFLKISLSGGQSSAGVAQWNFYHLAMTPALLLGSSKGETLQKCLAQSPASPDAAPPKALMAVRAQYPEKLNGFAYFDFQKVDWPALKAKWIADAKKAAESAKTADAAKSQLQLVDWLTPINPEVIPRHLHKLAGASWKDAKGVHFDQWLE